MNMVAAKLTEDVADVIKLALEAVVVEADTQCVGMVECHHHKLEKKGS
jgi:hypothetical protein